MRNSSDRLLRRQRKAAAKSRPQDTSKLHVLPLEDRVVPAVTGLVFQDFNANGTFDTAGSVANNAGGGSTSTAVDRGVPGVTVTAYGNNNAVAGSTITSNDGTYSLNTSGAGPYRIEFTGLATGVYFGPQGATSNTAIQNVATGNVANVNLAVVRPEDISVDNPTLVTSSYVYGGITNADPNHSGTVVVSFEYSAGADNSDTNRNDHAAATHKIELTQSAVGTTWGLAYDRTANKVFAAAYTKRTTGYGPGGPGAIYQIDATGKNPGALLADLNSLYPAVKPAGDLNALFRDSRNNPVPFRNNIADASYWSTDGLTTYTDASGVLHDVGWDAVGKSALGGLDTSDDGSRIYTVALADRRLYSLPTSGPMTTGAGGTVQQIDLPIPANVTGKTAANPLGDLRPFAVEYYRGLVYIGAVNSAETTQNKADLHAYVFAYDPATGHFINRARQATTTEAVLEFNLNYPRGNAHSGGDLNSDGSLRPSDSAVWNPWSPVHKSVNTPLYASGRTIYPQPMLTGLSFDADGSLVIGLRDRSGDQVGRLTPIDPNKLNDFSIFSVTAGDTLRAFINTPGNLNAVQASPTTNLSGWTLENNGRNPGATLGTAPLNSGQGPGNGEFYYQDDFPRDPSLPPIGVNFENDEVSMGGVAVVPGFNTTLATSFDPVRQVGAINGGGVRWYNSTTGASLKSYEYYISPTGPGATFAKGNGLGDLIAITGTPNIEIGNYVWNDANGNGIQDPGEAGLPGVEVDLTSAGGSILSTATTDANGKYYFSSAPGISTSSKIFGVAITANMQYQLRVPAGQAALSGKVFTVQDADATANGDQRDSDANAAGIVNVTTGVAGSAVHTFDIGVSDRAVLSLGDFVWYDLNNDGRLSAGETGFAGLTVNLFAANGTTFLGTTTTDGGGFYHFDNLDAGGYIVEVIAPAGYQSSTGSLGKMTGPFEPGTTSDENNADHGSMFGTTAVRSAIRLLDTPGGATNLDTNGVRPNNAYFRLDFGLFRPLSIGDLVWNDRNNDGIRQATEAGLAGVTVDLLSATGSVVATTVTNSSGGYLFMNLIPGTYRAAVERGTLPSSDYISSNGLQGLSGLDGKTAGPFEPAPGNTLDSTDHGTTAGSLVTGPMVILAYGTQPLLEAPTPGGIVDNAANEDSDRQQDFGFFRPLSIGNLVWNDTNNDGSFNNGESGINGVLVQLLDGNGSVLSATTTAGNGAYLFTNLIPGTYAVRITPPAGYISSTGTVGNLTRGPNEPGVSGFADSVDHGTTAGSFVQAVPVVLGEAGVIAANPDDGVANLRQDFGLFRPLSLGNFVWDDINNNGKLDAGEPGLSNVAVALYDGGNALVASMVTDAAGNYLFTGLTPGAYAVRVTTPSGYASSTGAPRSAKGPYEPGIVGPFENEDHGTANGTVSEAFVTLGQFGDASNPSTIAVPGDANLTEDFGFYRALSVGNFVWVDANNNGKLDSGESGLGGVTVQLLAGTSVIDTRVTDNAGGYLFADLIPGSYSVRIVTPAGYLSSTGTNGSTTGPFEPGKSGTEDNQDHGSASGTFIQAASFALGNPGSATNPDAGGMANLRQDFGLFRPLSLGNFVWADTNNNGSFDKDENGLGGVTVELFNGGFVIARTTTDTAGGYLFSNLAPGTYAVRITPLTGYISSTGASSTKGPFEPGKTGTEDSQDHGTTNGSYIQAANVTLGETGSAANPDNGGLANLRQDFGLFRPLNLGNLVWFDKDNDGILDNGETGLSGIEVHLLDGNGTTLATTTTNDLGLYNFGFLLPGTYAVEIVNTSDALVSSSGTKDSLSGPYEPAKFTLRDNFDKGTLLSGKIIRSGTGSLAATGNPDQDGTSNLRFDFGLTLRPNPPADQPASIAGYVYQDTYVTNGQRDPDHGEAGIAGVTITLTGVQNDGTAVRATTTTDAAGHYEFLTLFAGQYVITETQPRGFIDGIDTPGSLGGITPSNDVLAVGLNSGDNGIEYNFGEVLQGAVFGYVYEDVNRNHRKDDGEPAIPNTIVTLSGTAFAGTPMAHAITEKESLGGLVSTTDANGRWQFPGLPPGLYTVVETQPAGYDDFFESLQEPVDRPATIGNDIISTFPIAPRETRGALDFGEVRTVVPTRPSKQDFLGSTTTTTTQLPSTSPPVSTTPENVTLNPAFTVTTGKPATPTYIVAAAGAGLGPLVRVFDYATSTEAFRFYAYEPNFTGGIRVATGDVDGDGIDDIVTATGIGGGPRVRVFSGKDGTILKDFFAYESNFRGGVFVAVADVNGDGKADIITGTEVGGGPRVTVFDAVTGARSQDFFAFDGNQRGGVRVAAADFNGDGKADIVTTTGAGVPTRVRVYDGATHAILSDFQPYDAKFSGGVFVAAGDVTGDGRPDVITAADVGGGPHVQIFDGVSGKPVRGYYAYDSTFTGGVRLTTADVNGDGVQEIITAPGAGTAGRVKVWSASTIQTLDDFYAFDTTYVGGVFVG